jgi:hypothetical protein
LDSYLNFSTRSPIWFDKPMDLSRKSKEKPPYPEPEFRNISTDSKRYEAFLSRYQDTTFKLFLHCKEDDMQKQKDMSRFIKGGDLVRLRHTELEGYLTADNCYEDK